MRIFIVNAAIAATVLSVVWFPARADANEISKFLLIQMSRDQSQAFCRSETFTECMGFSQQQCEELSETAIEQCLAPLPDKIDPNNLENSVLEDCPQGVYADAGYSEEKAKQCFKEAVEEATGESADDKKE